MNRHTALTAFLCSTALGLPFIAGAQTASTMSDEQYGAAKEQIETRYEADKQRCDALSGNAEDVCEEEAQARKKVAEAELKHKRSGTPEDARDLAEVRVETNYEVAKEKCDGNSGPAKDLCLAEAKAAQAKAKADAAGAR